MRGTLLAIGSILALCTPARADYGADPAAAYNVDYEQSISNVFSPLSTNVIGSGSYAFATHYFDEVLAFNLSGTITGLTLDGELTGLRHLSAGGDDSNPTYASLGMPAGFGLSVAVIPAPPSLDATGLGATIAGSSHYVGYGTVDNGVAPGAIGPSFSITLGAAAIAAANQATAAGDPFYLVLSGAGSAGWDRSLEGDLSPVTLDVQATSPSFFFAPSFVPEPSTFALLLGGLAAVGIGGRLRARPRRGTSAGP